MSKHESFIQFQCQHVNLALPMSQVLQIESEFEFKPFPSGTPMIGRAKLGDSFAAVLDTARCLGLTPIDHPTKAQFLVVKDEDKHFVLVIDRVLRSKPIQAGGMEYLDPAIVKHTQHLIKAVSKGSPLVYLLNLQGFANLAGIPTKLSSTRQPIVSEASPPNKSSRPSLLSFSLDPNHSNLRWGISTSQVGEILKLEHVQPIINTPNFMPGFIWWRKSPAVVLDIQKKIIDAHDSGASRLLVIRRGSGQQPICLACQSDIRVEHHLDDFKPASLSGEVSQYAFASFKRNQDYLIIPDFDAILA